VAGIHFHVIASREKPMPYLDLKLSVPLSPEIVRKSTTALTELTAKLLGKQKELTAVTVAQVPPEQWAVGGEVLASSFFLEIKITAGTNTKNEKARYLAAAFEALQTLLGTVHPASYIVIHEVPADSWGYQGQTQESRYIRGKTQ
jgi:4-oxalocrotonate tautomerase